MDFSGKTLLGAIWELQTGAIPRTAMIAAARQRADEVEPWLHAFTYRPAIYPPLSGVLAGIPIALKDIIATAGMPTCNGSPFYAGNVPAEDAWIAAKIKNYGGTIFGKTVTTEFAWRHPGPTVNAWSRLHTPGGSSSGSAACVGAGIVPLAFGSQTLGSIIRPAAFNGVVGYKPSFGSMSLDGVHPLAGSLDHLGYFTRNVADAAAAFALFIEQTPEVVETETSWRDYFPLIEPPRLAVIRTEAWSRADAEQQGNFESSLTALRKAGAELTEMVLPASSDAIFEATLVILQYEAARIHQNMAANHPDQASDVLKKLVADGLAVTESDYHAALAFQKHLTGQFAKLVAPYHAVLTLPALGEAPPGLAFTGDATFCAAWSLMGAPAISIPSGWSSNMLPLGLQIASTPGADKQLLQVAAWAEGCINWAPGAVK
ncbi:MAG: amidase [Acidocella sp.]|nr:amidase [Acidocella sp.]